MSDRLTRRYAFWLRFSPPGPRRAEMLATLLECAPPERVRPTGREILNLVGYGLRARLGRPASTAVVVLAVLIALASGLLGAAAAARAGWAAAPSLPSGAESRALGETVFPGRKVWGGGDAETFVPSGDGEQTVYGFADYWIEHDDGTRDVLAYARGARDRLAAAGWDVHGDVTFEEDEESVTPIGTAAFWASRGDLVLSYTGVLWGDRAPWAPPAEVAHSRVARVYIAQDSTNEQRDYAQAAIARVWGATSFSFHYDPTDDEYRYAYCDGGELTGDSGMRVPYFWEIGLTSPGVFPALVDEVSPMPGVVAVRHGRAA
ncbi:hypothetical protein [Actinoplanes sp. CA-252034]|uniref:hypothetical protein n=1 Tax=Actinoplanes sp. CA-252034 TaxID=3239906 RepID=UPI003D971C43